MHFWASLNLLKLNFVAKIWPNLYFKECRLHIFLGHRVLETLNRSCIQKWILDHQYLFLAQYLAQICQVLVLWSHPRYSFQLGIQRDSWKRLRKVRNKKNTVVCTICIQPFNFILGSPEFILKITCNRNFPGLKLVQPIGLLEAIRCPNGLIYYPFFQSNCQLNSNTNMNAITMILG